MFPGHFSFAPGRPPGLRFRLPPGYSLDKGADLG
jgi:hypothetical protein